MRFLTVAVLLLVGPAFAEAGSVTIRNAAGTVQADVRTTDPAAGTAGLVVRIVPNAAIAQPVSQNGTWNVALSAGSNLVGTVKIGDGTNVGTVKAASTAAVASDTALVVAISPNNTVASTQSGTWTVQPGNTANTTAWLVTSGGNAATFNGQASVTTSAAALATQAAKSLCLKSLSTNTDVIYLGSSSGVTSGNGFPLYPGDTQCLNVSNENLVFAISASGTQTLGALGTN